MEKNLTLSVVAKVAGAISAMKQLGQAFADAFKFEKAEIQFRHLIGNIDEAKRHVEELREMGKTGAFDFDELASASRKLLTYSGGSLGGTDFLSTLSDAAAATGQSLDAMATTVGKFYDKLQEGEDITKAAKAMETAGLITEETRINLLELQDEGASGVEIWDALTESLEKFSGANAEMTKTAVGQLAELKAEVEDMGAKFAEKFFDPIKESAPSVKDALGGITTVVESIGTALGVVAGMASKVIGGFVALGSVIKDAIPGVRESEWNDQLAENIMKETEKAAEKAKQKKKLEEGDAKRKAKEEAEAEKQAKKDEATWEADTMKALQAQARAEERKRLEGIREQNKAYREQASLVEKIKDGIEDAKKAIISGYAGSLTSTGKIGGYQSAAEMSLANRMPGMDPQLDELKKQTQLLTEMKGKLDNPTVMYN